MGMIFSSEPTCWDRLDTLRATGSNLAVLGKYDVWSLPRFQPVHETAEARLIIECNFQIACYSQEPRFPELVETWRDIVVSFQECEARLIEKYFKWETER